MLVLGHLLVLLVLALDARHVYAPLHFPLSWLVTIPGPSLGSTLLC